MTEPLTPTDRPAQRDPSPDGEPGPTPARRDELVEVLHGHPVADPYRWLEAPADDPQVRAFVDEQDRHARAHLAGLPARAALRSRLEALWDHPRRSAPWRRGGSWFQFRNDGLQDQDVLWTAPADADHRHEVPPAERWRVLLDPGTWSEDGSASLAHLAASQDGTLLAVGRADAGSDWTTWSVVEVATGTPRPDRVPWSKFSGAAWLPDGSGFVYGAYEPPEQGATHAAANLGQRLLLHRLGTAASEDVLVHADPHDPELGFHPIVSHDGRWLLVVVTRGTDPETGVRVAPIDEQGHLGAVRTLLEGGLAHHAPIGVVGDELLVHTDLDAPLGRVVAVDLTDGRVREVVAEGTDRLEDVALAGAAAPGEPGWLVCNTLHHATSRLVVHPLHVPVPDPAGGHETDQQPAPRTVPLPWPVTVTGLSTTREAPSLAVAVGSFTAPDHLLVVDLPALEVRALWSPAATGTGAAGTGADTAAAASADAEVVVEQVAIHHDGVAVPLFVLHRADVLPDGQRPTVLWGYGGFDVPVTPMHRPGWRAWVEAGGVLAVACLRGGGEYGRAWRDAGRRHHKEQVFDDALACAAWLTGTRTDEVHASRLGPVGDAEAVWSRPSRLGIEGRSNGGLLAAACLTRAPGSFGAAVPEVGVLDLVRFHRFTIGWAWTSDYGSPDDPDDLAVLLRYSPYHRLEEGRTYPPTLLTTGDTDDRVVPAHSYKFAAALQHAQGGDAPVLLRVDRAAGHGAGKPTSQLLDERADVLAFHAAHLGLEVDAPG
ncbi:MAG: prolyl oligopeptidase family serine peptidase [Nitriliruptoraceae bacterium]